MGFVEKQANVRPDQVIALADKDLCVPLLHYAVLEKGLKRIILRNSLASWRALAQTERYDPLNAYSIVPNALPFYDIPDLLKLLAPRQLIVIQAENGMGEPLPDKAADRFYTDIKALYKNKGGQFELYGERQFKEIVTGLKSKKP